MVSVKVEAPTLMSVAIIQVVLDRFGVSPGLGLEAHIDFSREAIIPELLNGHTFGEVHRAVQAHVAFLGLRVLPSMPKPER